jgi:DNA-binding response OmpR family regulator
MGGGVEVREAGAVLPAIDLLAAEAFDCVLLDFNLPDGDGLTFLRGVRAAGIATPVVMLTGQQDERIQADLVASGAADYIPKGDLTPLRLRESLRHAVPGWAGADDHPSEPRTR